MRKDNANENLASWRLGGLELYTDSDATHHHHSLQFHAHLIIHIHIYSLSLSLSHSFFPFLACFENFLKPHSTQNIATKQKESALCVVGNPHNSQFRRCVCVWVNGEPNLFGEQNTEGLHSIRWLRRSFCAAYSLGLTPHYRRRRWPGQVLSLSSFPSITSKIDFIICVILCFMRSLSELWKVLSVREHCWQRFLTSRVR